MTIAWDDEMKARAKREKLWLYKVVFQGKHAGTGMVEGAGTMDADRVTALLCLLTAERSRVELVIAQLNKIAKVEKSAR